MTRKYQTTKKTTTAEGMREYNKLLKRDIRKRQREENKAALERIRAFPEFQQLSKKEQKNVEKTFLHNLADVDKILAEKLKEVALYSGKKIEQFYDYKFKTVLELSLQLNQKAEQLKEMLNKNE